MMRISIRQRLTAVVRRCTAGRSRHFRPRYVGLAPGALGRRRGRAPRATHAGPRNGARRGGEIRDRAQLQQELAELRPRDSGWQPGAVAQHPRATVLLPTPKSADTPALPRRDRAVHGASWRDDNYGSRLPDCNPPDPIYDAQVAVSLDEILGVMQDFRHLLLLLIPGVLIVCLPRRLLAQFAGPAAGR